MQVKPCHSTAHTLTNKGLMTAILRIKVIMINLFLKDKIL